MVGFGFDGGVGRDGEGFMVVGVVDMVMGVVLTESGEADHHELDEEEHDDGHEHDRFDPGVLHHGTS